MAVLIEGISVVVRCNAIVTAYKGGPGQFTAEVPNGSLRADGLIAAVTFMHPTDVEQYVRLLEARGLVFQDEEGTRDIVVVDQRTGFCNPCAWADFGTTPWNGDQNRLVAVCAIDADQPQKVVVPDGWAYETSLTARHRFVESDPVTEGLRFVRRDGDVNVYFDEKTGKEFYSVQGVGIGSSVSH